jgi:hypothetical protein
MNRPWTRLAAAALAIAILSPPAPPAAAAPLYDWDKAGVPTYEDPAGDTRHDRGPYIACLDIVSARATPSTARTITSGSTWRSSRRWPTSRKR